MGSSHENPNKRRERERAKRKKVTDGWNKKNEGGARDVKRAKRRSAVRSASSVKEQKYDRNQRRRCACLAAQRVTGSGESRQAKWKVPPKVQPYLYFLYIQGTGTQGRTGARRAVKSTISQMGWGWNW
jgi:hypothetical protein